MIVVDTNIIAHFWMPSDHSQICDDLFQQDPVWVAPILWKSEFRSVVALYLGKSLIDLSEALQITESAEKQMKGHEFHVNSLQIFSLVNRSECSSYDCEYIGLAKDLDIKMVTLDKKILQSFPDLAVDPSHIIS